MKKSPIKMMHEQLDMSTSSPIKVKWCDYDHFTYPWHFHSEYEIVYIIKSTGTRFAGNNIETYNEEDLTLLGSFLPHMYRSDEIYYEGNPALRVHAIVIQFSKDFFSHAFQYYPEFHKIKLFLEKSASGVWFNKTEGINRNIRKNIVRLLKIKGLDRLLECIKLLSLMSKSSDIRFLDDSGSLEQIHDNRITKVLTYINKSGYQSIQLKDIAGYSGMNPAAFCRYFREKTGKTLIRHVNELRIQHACRLLLEGKYTISQICYECGFNNVSNFNRQFRKICKYTPTEYLNEYGRKV